MKLLQAVSLALLSSVPFASALRKGFNVPAEASDGTCKTQGDWELNFRTIKNLGFPNARLYASSDCNTLQNAVPAALNTGIQLLVGVWTEDAGHYNAEKQALLNACKAHGVKWISAISVGSEDLYRGDTTASALANQIYDVRGMMTTVGGKGIWVGHVDTWTAWVNDANAAVIKACDFIGMDGYPYFQGSTIGNAKNVFYQSVSATKAAIQKYKPNTPLWITETGWPVAGPNFGPSVPSVANARTYWQQVICTAIPQYTTFVYTIRDYYVAPKSPSFGVLNAAFKPIYSLAC